METLLLIVHVLACIVLIVIILLQPGKGGGLSGGAFGGMGGGSAMFGGAGATTFLTKVTTYVAIVFACTCIGLWYASRSGSDALPETAAERMLENQSPQPFQQPAGPQPFAPSTEQTAPVESTAPATAPADTTR